MAESKRTTRNNMLSIRNLHAGVSGREILRGVDLEVKAGEMHAIMGPNGSGKSTLAQVLAGRDLLYEVTAGKVTYEEQNLLAMKPEDRAREGIFLAFQYPVEIPGVSNMYFLSIPAQALAFAVAWRSPSSRRPWHLPRRLSFPDRRRRAEWRRR